MAPGNAYITEAQFEKVLKTLNVEYDDEDQQELLDRATGEMEADLAERFVVPLVEASGGSYASTPLWSRSKVMSALRAKIRQVIGADSNRNVVVESNQRFIDLHASEYTKQLKALLNPKIIFGFKMQGHADGAVTPIQSIGLARADNELSVEDDPDV